MPQSGLVRALPPDRAARGGARQIAAATANERTASRVPYYPPAVVSGVRRYSIPGMTITATNTEVTVGPNLIFYTPCVFPAPWRADQASIDVTTTAVGSSVRLGMYRMGEDGQPAGPPIFDSGSISSASGGAKNVAINIGGGAGWYLFAVAADALVKVRGSALYTIPSDLNPSSFGGGSNVIHGNRQASFTYATLPTTGPSWTSSVDSSGPSAGAPLFGVRWWLT